MSQEWKLVSTEFLGRVVRAIAQVGVQDHLADYKLAGDVKREVSDLLTAAPVPPAGGEVEVLGWLSVDKLMPTQQDAKEYAGYKGQGDVKELVDRAHVTRLQAEVDAERQETAAYKHTAQKLLAERDALKAEMESERKLRRQLGVRIHELKDQAKDMQSELTKARVWERLAGYLLDNCEGQEIYEERLQYWLSEMLDKEAHQSAPAAKGEGDDV